MKSILLLLVIIPTLVCSQSIVFTHGLQNIIAQSASHGTLSSGQKIAVMKSYDYNNSHDVNTVVKFDANGAVQNQFSFVHGSGEYLGLIGVTPMNNDEYIIGFENYYGNFYLVSFASDNTVLWKKTYTVPSYLGAYYQHQIIKDDAGGLYLMISCSDNSTLLKINSLGNIEWSKAYVGPDSGGKSPGFSICLTPDNGVIGTLKDGSSQCVFRVNSQGTVQWSKSFVDMSYRWPVSVSETNDGNYIVAGILDGSIPYVHKISSSGDLIFAKTYNYYFELFDAKQHSNGNFYFIGSDGMSPSIIETDQNGNVLSAKFFEGVVNLPYEFPKFDHNESDLSFYLRTFDQDFHTRINFDGNTNTLCDTYETEAINSLNDYLITQATINTDLYVNDVAVVTDTENITLTMLSGYDVTAEDFCEFIVALDENAQVDNIEIYPNPVIDQITINTNGGNISQIEFFDLHGKSVQHQLVDGSGVQTIDVSNLSPGIYRLVMMVDGNLVNEQILIGN